MLKPEGRFTTVDAGPEGAPSWLRYAGDVKHASNGMPKLSLIALLHGFPTKLFASADFARSLATCFVATLRRFQTLIVALAMISAKAAAP